MRRKKSSNRRATLGQWVLKRLSSRSKPRSKPRAKPAKITSRAITAVPAEPQRTELAVVEKQDSRYLSVEQLIRPDSKLRQSIEGFLLDQRSEHTRRAYGRDLQRFFRYLAPLQHQFLQIDRHVLIGHKDQLLGEGLQHTTIDRHIATLRSFFGWLVDDGFLERNPAEGVKFLNPKRMSPTVGFSDEEVVRVLKYPDLHTRTGAQHYAILMLLFYCGLRRSELCSLRTSNLSIERGQPLIRLVGKGNSERMIPLIPPVTSALNHFFLITGKHPQIGQGRGLDQWLFSPIRNNRTGETDRALDSSMIFYIVRRYAKMAGIQSKVSPHSCRATAISNARDHNVPDRAIQEFAGWSTPDMITRYDKRKTAIEKSAAHAIKYST